MCWHGDLKAFASINIESCDIGLYGRRHALIHMRLWDMSYGYKPILFIHWHRVPILIDERAPIQPMETFYFHGKHLANTHQLSNHGVIKNF